MSEDARGNYGVAKPKPKQYIDYPYTREVVDKAEVLALVREVLGLNQGELSKLVVDGRINPVVVLNDLISYKSWSLVNTVDITSLMGAGTFTCFVDNDGVVHGNDNGWNISFEVYLDGSFDDMGSYMTDLVYVQNFNRCGKYTIDLEVASMKFFRVRRGGKTLWYFTVPDLVNETIGSISISPNGKYLSCSTYNTAVVDLVYVFRGVY